MKKIPKPKITKKIVKKTLKTRIKQTKKKSSSKLEQIIEILGIIEEKGKGKDWVLEEVKKHRIKLNVPATSSTSEILKSSPQKFILHLSGLLKEDEFSVPEQIDQTRTLHWFFTDIVGSSNPKISTKAQVRKINILQTLIQKTETFKKRDTHSGVILPTGDGMAMGFAESPEQPLRLAIEIHKGLNKYNKTQREKDKIQIRIGLDTGAVYFIKDVEGTDTVWGPGIITARRVMDLCGANHIFASQRIGDDISNLSPEYKEIMHPIGDYEVKHGGQFLIYNIYGKSFGNKIPPKKGKILDSSDESDFPVKGPKFEFNSVEVRLDVTDPKSMMTHHTWIWNVKNNSKKPLEQVFYDIGGDVSKDFSELNVSIKDENEKKLEIISLDVNKDHEKKFNVQLAKPIRKNQTGRILKLEYDWEEPDRIFEYVFSANCKRFKYVFTIPKDSQIKNRVLEVARELGIKKRAEPPAKTRYLDDRTEITWENDKKNVINRFDSYEFQW